MSTDRPLGRHDLDLPYEPNPSPAELDLSDGHIAGGVVVLGATLPVDGHGVKPAIVFRFAKPDGTFYPPMVLVSDPDQIAALKPLVYAAANAALRTARDLNARTAESGSTEGESV